MIKILLLLFWLQFISQIITQGEKLAALTLYRALIEILKEGRNDGREEGRKEGRNDGREEGRREE